MTSAAMGSNACQWRLPLINWKSRSSGASIADNADGADTKYLFQDVAYRLIVAMLHPCDANRRPWMRRPRLSAHHPRLDAGLHEQCLI
jgi:hypothetical protein